MLCSKIQETGSEKYDRDHVREIMVLTHKLHSDKPLICQWLLNCIVNFHQVSDNYVLSNS